MSIEGDPKIDRELSVYGEVVEACRALPDAGPGKSVVKTFYAEEGTPRRADLAELTELLKRNEFTFYDLDFFYSIIANSAYMALNRGRQADCPEVILFESFRDNIFLRLPSVIDSAEAIVRFNGTASPKLLGTYARARKLFTDRPDFVEKIIEAAFNDAILRLEMERVFQSVAAVMDDCDMPVDDEEGTEEDVALEGDEEPPQYDA